MNSSNHHFRSRPTAAGEAPLAASIDLERFESGDFDPAQFHHRDHVRVAFEMLARYTFADAAARLSNGLRAMAARAGRPEAYHETVTIAFLSLIAERMELPAGSFDSFAERNPELFDKGALIGIYAKERLDSAIARRTFVLPR